MWTSPQFISSFGPYPAPPIKCTALCMGQMGGHQEEWSGYDLGGCPVRNDWCLYLLLSSSHGHPPHLQDRSPSSPKALRFLHAEGV